MTENRITASALARAADCTRATATAWLRGERKTHAAKEAALEAAFLKLGGTILKQDGELGFFEAVLAGGRRAVKS